MFKSLKLNKLLIYKSDLIYKTSFPELVRHFSSSKKNTKGALNVHVIDEDGKFLFSGTMEFAKKYAKKHDLNLINYETPNSPKTLQMQVISKKKLFEEEPSSESLKIDKKPKKQNVKKYFLNENTEDYDIETKTKRMAYFLNKSYNIRLVINGFKMDQKMKVLDKIKKKFAPHLAFKQIRSNQTSIKLVIVPEKSFQEFYAHNYLKDEEKFDDVSDNEEFESEDESLIDKNELEDLINKKIK